MWFVYILKCADGTFYTGITTDVKRRVREHNGSSSGAKYTRGRRPVKLVYSRRMRNKPLAAKAEYRIKKMSKLEKINPSTFTAGYLPRGKIKISIHPRGRNRGVFWKVLDKVN